MAGLTIRKLDDELKRRLRQRAAANDRSMEEEARVILRRALHDPQRQQEGLGTLIRREVERLGGGIDFDLPADEPYEPMTFDRE